MTMPWGKYEGYSLDDIPAGYLVWCLEERSMDEWLRVEIKKALVKRLKLQPVSCPHHDLPAIIDRWFRRLALKWHPDRGGDHKAMQALNDAHELLRKDLFPRN